MTQGVELRETDVREVRALGFTPDEAVRLSATLSDNAFTQSIGGEPVAYWGWRRDHFLSSTARVWMLSTPAADAHPVAFARESVRLRDTLLHQFHTLRADVHAAHTVAVRWLEWLGFRVVAARAVGTETFYTMQRDR